MRMHVYLRAQFKSQPFTEWPKANAWCGKVVRYSETVNLRGNLSGVEICEACASAIEHGKAP